MGFEQILGQDHALAALRNALESRRLAHAYLFEGPDGVGKTLTARTLAQTLMCHDSIGPAPALNPCGHCAGCVKTEKDIHPDLITLTPSENSRVIRIEQIRELQRLFRFKPYESARRVVLIPNGEIMTEESANSLLKLLEEPPENTHFILITSAPHKLLITIRSRCQKVKFAPLERELAARLVLNERAGAGLSEEQAQIACALAGGSVGTALLLIDGGFMDDREQGLRTMGSITPWNPSLIGELVELWTTRSRQPSRESAKGGAPEKSGGTPRQKQDRSSRAEDRRNPLIYWFMLVSSWLRDILMIHHGIHSSNLLNTDLTEQLEQMAAKTSSLEVLKLLDMLQEKIREVDTMNANPRMAAEAFLAAWAQTQG